MQTELQSFYATLSPSIFYSVGKSRRLICTPVELMTLYTPLLNSSMYRLKQLEEQQSFALEPFLPVLHFVDQACPLSFSHRGDQIFCRSSCKRCKSASSRLQRGVVLKKNHVSTFISGIPGFATCFCH